MSRESRDVAEENARGVLYVWGNREVRELQSYLDERGENEIALHMDDMIEAFKKGVAQYMESLSVIQKKRVYERSRKMFVNVDTIRGNNE